MVRDTKCIYQLQCHLAAVCHHAGIHSMNTVTKRRPAHTGRTTCTAAVVCDIVSLPHNKEAGGRDV